MLGGFLEPLKELSGESTVVLKGEMYFLAANVAANLLITEVN